MTVIGVYCGVFANLLVSMTNSTLFPAAAAEIGGMEIYDSTSSIYACGLAVPCLCLVYALFIPCLCLVYA